MLGPHPRLLLRDLGSALRQDAADLVVRLRAAARAFWWGGHIDSRPAPAPEPPGERAPGREACASCSEAPGDERSDCPGVRPSPASWTGDHLDEALRG